METRNRPPTLGELMHAQRRDAMRATSSTTTASRITATCFAATTRRISSA